MIKEPIVFVLGAGASAPYGFPFGTGLINEIIKNLNNNYIQKILYPIHVEGDIKLFINNLGQSGSMSIDHWLMNRNDDELMKLGKKIIALTILIKENPENILKDKPDGGYGQPWYNYLIHKYMNDKPNVILKNNVCFYTFNYDRSLEYYFTNYLTKTFNMNIVDSENIIKQFKLYHIHGCIGDFRIKTYEYISSVYYKKGIDSSHIIRNYIEKGCDDLVLLEEDRKKEFDRFGHLFDAKRIIFLGLSYHKENMDRILKIIHRGELTPIISGSAYKLSSNEQSRVKRLFKEYGLDIDLGHSDWDTLEFLRNHSSCDFQSL